MAVVIVISIMAVVLVLALVVVVTLVAVVTHVAVIEWHCADCIIQIALGRLHRQIVSRPEQISLRLK